MKKKTQSIWLYLAPIAFCVALIWATFTIASNTPNKATHVARMAPVLMDPQVREFFAGASIVHQRQPVEFKDVVLTRHIIPAMAKDDKVMFFFDVQGMPFHKVVVVLQFGETKPVKLDDIFKPPNP